MKRETAANFTRLAAIVVAVLALALVPAALAGQGGKGKSKPSDRPTTAQLSFSASQVAVGQQYQVNGSGFGAYAYVSVGARYPNANIWWGGYANAQGQVSIPFTAVSAGQIVHEGHERMSNGQFSLRASATLTVTG
jgi:hypothetical protein